MGHQNAAVLGQVRRSEDQEEESIEECEGQVIGWLLGDGKGRAGVQKVIVTFGIFRGP